MLIDTEKMLIQCLPRTEQEGRESMLGVLLWENQALQKVQVGESDI